MNQIISKLWVLGKMLKLKIIGAPKRLEKAILNTKVELLLDFLAKNDIAGANRFLKSLSKREPLYKKLNHIDGETISFYLYTNSKSAEMTQVLYSFGCRIEPKDYDNYLMKDLLKKQEYNTLKEFFNLGLHFKEHKNNELQYLLDEYVNEQLEPEQKIQYLDLIQLLIKNGVSPDENKEGVNPALFMLSMYATPSHIYAEGGLLSLLLPYCDINLKFKSISKHEANGLTAIQIASSNCQEGFLLRTIDYYKNDLAQLKIFETELNEVLAKNIGVDLILHNKCVEEIKSYIDKIVLEEEFPAVGISMATHKKINKI